MTLSAKLIGIDHQDSILDIEPIVETTYSEALLLKLPQIKANIKKASKVLTDKQQNSDSLR